MAGARRRAHLRPRLPRARDTRIVRLEHRVGDDGQRLRRRRAAGRLAHAAPRSRRPTARPRPRGGRDERDRRRPPAPPGSGSAANGTYSIAPDATTTIRLPCHGPRRRSAIGPSELRLSSPRAVAPRRVRARILRRGVALPGGHGVEGGADHRLRRVRPGRSNGRAWSPSRARERQQHRVVVEQRDAARRRDASGRVRAANPGRLAAMALIVARCASVARRSRARAPRAAADAWALSTARCRATSLSARRCRRARSRSSSVASTPARMSIDDVASTSSRLRGPRQLARFERQAIEALGRALAVQRRQHVDVILVDDVVERDEAGAQRGTAEAGADPLDAHQRVVEPGTRVSQPAAGAGHHRREAEGPRLVVRVADRPGRLGSAWRALLRRAAGRQPLRASPRRLRRDRLAGFEFAVRENSSRPVSRARPRAPGCRPGSRVNERRMALLNEDSPRSPGARCVPRPRRSHRRLALVRRRVSPGRVRSPGLSPISRKSRS